MDAKCGSGARAEPPAIADLAGFVNALWEKVEDITASTLPPHTKRNAASGCSSLRRL